MFISMGSEVFPAKKVIKGLRAAARRARAWKKKARHYKCSVFYRTPDGVM